MLPKKYWRDSYWFKYPTRMFSLKEKRDNKHYTENDVVWEVYFNFPTKKYTKAYVADWYTKKEFINISYPKDRRPCRLNEIFRFRITENGLNDIMN